jgi:hypothetical protein
MAVYDTYIYNYQIYSNNDAPSPAASPADPALPRPLLASFPFFPSAVRWDVHAWRSAKEERITGHGCDGGGSRPNPRSRRWWAAAAVAGLLFGRGGLSTPPSHSLGPSPRGVGLPPPPRARGRGSGSIAAPTTLPATATSSMDGGGFPGSSSASTGFPFPHPPSFDTAGVDPSSPGW